MSRLPHYDILLRQADTAAAASIAGAGVSVVASVNEWVQLLAGLLAIISGLIAIYFHIERFMLIRKRGKLSENNSGSEGS